jgi:ABC-type uncharacterized transport system permease subunit
MLYYIDFIGEVARIERSGVLDAGLPEGIMTVFSSFWDLDSMADNPEITVIVRLSPSLLASILWTVIFAF